MVIHYGLYLVLATDSGNEKVVSRAAEIDEIIDAVEGLTLDGVYQMYKNRRVSLGIDNYAALSLLVRRLQDAGFIVNGPGADFSVRYGHAELVVDPPDEAAPWWMPTVIKRQAIWANLNFEVNRSAMGHGDKRRLADLVISKDDCGAES